MACAVGAYAKALKSLTDKGMSDKEAVNLLSKGDKFKDIVESGIRDDTIGATELNGLLTNSYTSENTAAMLVEIQPKENLLKIQPDLQESGAWKAIEKQTGFEAWTKLPGKFDWNKANDDKYLLQYIQAGDKEALKIVEYAKSEAKKGNVKTLVSLVGDLSKASVSETKKLLNDDAELKDPYEEFFGNWKNIAQEDITIDSLYGTLKWVDYTGTEYKLDVVDGSGKVWSPTENDGKGGYISQELIPSEFKTKQGYDSATFTLDRAKYAKEFVLGVEGKTADEVQQIMLEKGFLTKDKAVNLLNGDFYTCVGTLCGAQQPAESGSGGSGGGGDSKSFSSTEKAESTTEALYVECDVPAAVVIDKGNGMQLGSVNTTITMKKGSYTIQVKANGYKTRETPVTIGDYPVSKTMNLTKIGPSISTFIRGIGGIQHLTKEKYLYLYCVYMMRITSAYEWKQFAETVTTVESSALPTIISKNDVLYVYYLANGDITSAQALVDAGSVTLLDADGGETEETINADEIGKSGGI